MTPKELEKFKLDLLKELTEIEAALGYVANPDPSIPGNWKAHFHKADQSDTNDEKAQSVTDLEQERAVEQNLEVKRKEILETLKKIDDGTFGVCDKCSAPIDGRRLKVLPLARFCVNCANKARLM